MRKRPTGFRLFPPTLPHLRQLPCRPYGAAVRSARAQSETFLLIIMAVSLRSEGDAASEEHQGGRDEHERSLVP
jgi:hypothetical protein